MPKKVLKLLLLAPLISEIMDNNRVLRNKIKIPLGFWQEKIKRTKLEIILLIILVVLLSVLICIPTLLVLCSQEECDSEFCLQAANKFHQFLNPKVDPCTNFYEFACGNFIEKYSHENCVSSPFDEHEKRVKNQIVEIITEPIKSDDTNSLVLLKTLHQSCMNLEQIDDTSDKTILDLVWKLGGWPVLEESGWDEKNRDFHWVQATILARKLGVKYDWFLQIKSTKYSDYIIPKISYPKLTKFMNRREEGYYFYVMSQTAVHFGAKSTRANREMLKVLEFENKLLELIKASQLSSKSKIEEIVQVQNKWPQINWIKLIYNVTTIKKDISDDYLIENDIDFYLEELENLISTTPKQVQANYIVWKIIYPFREFLAEGLRSKFEVLDLIRTQMHGDRLTKCISFSNSVLDHVVESEYVRRFVNSYLKRQVTDLFTSIRFEFVREIFENKWMDQETKSRATNKTFNVLDLIGGPEDMYQAKYYDKILGLDTFDFESSNIIERVTQIQLKQLKTEFGKIYEKNDRASDRFNLDWTSIGSGFHTTLNTIMMAAPILQDDFFTLGRPNYLNYGGLGVSISYELLQGFDREIIAYAEHTSRQEDNPWITISDQEKYSEKLDCLQEYQKSQKNETNSDFLSDQVADFIGVNIAYHAYQSASESGAKSSRSSDIPLPGLEFTPSQLFWIQAASFMCYNPLYDEERNGNVELAPGFRVNSAFRNSRFFSTDFSCPINSHMNPETKCEII